jgi:isoleucyl-tRNA synthetase
MHTIFHTLVALLAPILTFTCDEALSQALHGTDFGDSHVQLLDWPRSDAMADFSEEEKEIDALLIFRAKVNEQLEIARQNKCIGQSLDAKVIIMAAADDKILPLLKKHFEILPEMFIVSQVDIVDDSTGNGCSVRVVAASGERCPRSWKWVNKLVEAGEFGMVSEKCFEALAAKYPHIVKQK